MSKIIKYALAVATLLIACATLALAADGDPVVAILNGQPYSSFEDAVLASKAGDSLIVVGDASLSSEVSIRADLTIKHSASLTVNSGGKIFAYGHNCLYGDVNVLPSSGNYFYNVMSGQTEVFGNIYSSNQQRLLFVSSSGTGKLSIFGGSFNSQLFSVANGLSAENVQIFGGTFLSPISGPYVLHGHIVSSDPLIVSYGGLYELGQIVSEAISWIGLFCAAIVNNKLLLIFVIFVFGFVGLGLIKRMINN